MFVVYGWFGVLKVIGLSPASDLVQALQERTLPFLEFEPFSRSYGGFEVLIGLLALFPGATRVALALLGMHVATTVLPLVVLPDVAWQRLLVPTLEGQYIIKNVLILAAAGTILEGERRRTPRAPMADERPDAVLGAEPERFSGSIR